MMGNSVLVTDGTAEVGSESGRPSYPGLFNETDWDAQRGNTEGIAIASAARTATTHSANLVSHNARGLLAELNITVASGTGGLQLGIYYVGPNASAWLMSSLPVAKTTTGIQIVALYPAAIASVFSAATDNVLPRTFDIGIVAGDGSSYTYSVSYSLIL